MPKLSAMIFMSYHTRIFYFMHRKFIDNIVLISQILNHRIDICIVLKQNRFFIFENIYVLKLFQINLQILKNIQKYNNCIFTIFREKFDIVVVAIFDLRSCLTKLKFRQKSLNKIILLTILKMFDFAAIFIINWIFDCT